MEKENFEDGEDLPSKMNQGKEQIEKERFLDINNNGKDNALLSRMQRPLRHFSGFSDDQNEEVHILDKDGTLPTVELPFVEQLPRSITCVFTDRNMLMDKGASVNGKRQQLHRVSSEENEKFEEETKEENFEFSKDTDRFIWMIGQEYDLDDLVVQSTLTKFLKLDISYVLERYTKLKLKKEENAGESFDLGSKSIISTFQDLVDRHFCRRCLIFDCHMHEKSQPESKHIENKSNLSENEDDRRQCSERCYLKVREADYVEDNDNSLPNKKQKNVISEDTIWTPVEKDLYLKGVEIFGRNSCLITQNILSGLKSCLEVYDYMHEQDHCTVLLDHDKTTETDNQVKKKVSRKSTKLLYNTAKLRKYSRYPPALRKQAIGQARFHRQYTPCTCDSICGDQCICLTNGNCCEKYCGCPKKCNNRFEGCNCAKSECRNRQCPCFAANRECDPDLCRSCKPSYGDGSLGHETSSEQRQCNNMNILLKKHKRILIAKSDVHGWGAFTRDSLTKNEFLGEYTGELITEEEENERWKEDYNKHGTSYFFDLNDQLEIDARRKGNKFRFLNHSKEPNCFAKVMIVRGDHRIGIFAGKDIKEGEELFLDYGYGPEQAAWSRGRVSEMSTHIGPSS
ncbi:Histone-lysine N-methyltransferase MEDEA [Cardamine amara subsp. amara]|uniref:Histone-lysine N-methyltransferase MEDEA n=1 Tax=Cardamine amara subsp. amara TaxID=228776 RepID=A0ABD1B8Q1_CARAN